MFLKAFVLLGYFLLVSCEDAVKENGIVGVEAANSTDTLTPCICGVFLSGQFKRGQPPVGGPVLLHEYDDSHACNPIGNKQCTNKCLDVLVKHLSNSPMIICGSIDRDCYKERAYLFIKNCNPNWINTNLSAGREYCCKDGTPYKCPFLK